MGGLRSESGEIPEIIVSGLTLRNFSLGLGFSRVNDVREFDCILNEEDWNVVANEVPIALTGVELDSKTTDISNCICRTTRSQDGGETKEEWRFI